MKRQTIYAALALLALATPAAAQGYGPQGYPEQGYPAQGYPAGGLAPREVFSILRSTGLDPLGPPMRRGPNYVLRAVDENDREVRVVVNARSGDVLSVTPVQTASRMPPQRGGVTMGAYERMPPGYVPSDADRSAPPAGYRPGAPVADDEGDENAYNDPVSRPPGPIPGALPLSRSSNAAPPPRGGATPRDRDEDVSSLSEPNVITADPDRSGMLPPPPERFPQRAAPAAPPKPMKRTAAAPPKQAPLPKPKPAAKADAPPATAPQAQPQPSPPAAPGEETPN